MDKTGILTVDPPVGSIGTATTHGSSLNDDVLNEKAILVQHLRLGIALRVPKQGI